MAYRLRTEPLEELPPPVAGDEWVTEVELRARIGPKVTFDRLVTALRRTGAESVLVVTRQPNGKPFRTRYYQLGPMVEYFARDDRHAVPLPPAGDEWITQTAALKVFRVDHVALTKAASIVPSCRARLLRGGPERILFAKQALSTWIDTLRTERAAKKRPRHAKATATETVALPEAAISKAEALAQGLHPLTFPIRDTDYATREVYRLRGSGVPAEIVQERRGVSVWRGPAAALPSEETRTQTARNRRRDLLAHFFGHTVERIVGTRTRTR